VALPWLGIIDAALGVANFVRGRKPATEPTTAPASPFGPLGRPPGMIEQRLTGVAVAALKEVFNRDSRRLELEREQYESARLRAERAQRLELIRQSGDRELARLRIMTGVALVCWLTTLLVAVRVASGSVLARVTLGFGWASLLAALALAMSAQPEVARAVERESMPTDGSGSLTQWLIVGGLALCGLSVLL
jgi:hypothetical protein